MTEEQFEQRLTEEMVKWEDKIRKSEHDAWEAVIASIQNQHAAELSLVNNVRNRLQFKK